MYNTLSHALLFGDNSFLRTGFQNKFPFLSDVKNYAASRPVLYGDGVDGRVDLNWNLG